MTEIKCPYCGIKNKLADPPKMFLYWCPRCNKTMRIKQRPDGTYYAEKISAGSSPREKE